MNILTNAESNTKLVEYDEEQFVRIETHRDYVDENYEGEEEGKWISWYCKEDHLPLKGEDKEKIESIFQKQIN